MRIVATDKESEPKEGGLFQALKYMHLAFILPCSAIAGWILGGFVDSWLETTWVNRAGAVFGIGVGIFEVVRILVKIKREMQ
jgi:hypothetical protein